MMPCEMVVSKVLLTSVALKIGRIQQSNQEMQAAASSVGHAACCLKGPWRHRFPGDILGWHAGLSLGSRQAHVVRLESPGHTVGRVHAG